MRVSVHIVPRPSWQGHGVPNIDWLDDILGRVDGYDIDRLTIGDAQGNHLECFSGLGYIAAKTQRVQIGPNVTNAVTRDVGVIAAAGASLDAMSRGRSFLSLSRGDGVVRNLDLKASSVAELREAIVAIRALLHDGACEYRGRKLRLDWPDRPGPRVPIYTAVGGPRMLEMSAEVCDGVCLATGCTEGDVQGSLATIEKAGRETPLDVWWVTRFGIGDTFEQALDVASEGISSMGNHSLQGDYGARGVPEDLRPALAEYHRRYDYRQKNPLGGWYSDTGEKPFTNVDLMNELGLRDYFIDRFSIVGTPEQVVERMIELERRGVHSAQIFADSVHDLDLIGTQVMPKLNKHTSTSTTQ
jgi:5,10-methylenetetrahydromethanopterin reductase